MFETDYAQIEGKIRRINPVAYGQSRNYVDGAVTYLSPYISRGVISTRQVLETVLSNGYQPSTIEKFIQELAWRDYWQQVWKSNGEKINEDLKQRQLAANRIGLPANLNQHQTGIGAIDRGIDNLYRSGYLHNHLRMYVASMACNMAQCHWKIPAQWMYYHLLDADWASNALSWQWVSGANSHKLYYANQDNINQFCRTNQSGTFLDKSYEDLMQMPVPEELQELVTPKFITPLPTTAQPSLQEDLPTLIYNFYNLDPFWRSDMPANRVLLLEPSVFKRYPVSQKSIDFCLELATSNIIGIQIWVAEFSELQLKVSGNIYFKEHPLNKYVGVEDARSWMSSVEGDYPSFFAFWKRCRKELF